MKLHLGSGSINLDAWLNIDMDAPAADMHLDLTNPLPFEKESVSHIFSEHFIEHISRNEALNLLKECHRVMREDATLRISTPNLKYLTFSYLSQNINAWGDLWQPANACAFMNEGMRSWGHKYLYDNEELIGLLNEAGFMSLELPEWRASRHQELTNLETRAYHYDLIIEASKESPNNVSTELQISTATPLALLDAEKANFNQINSLEKIAFNQAIYIKQLEKNAADQTINISHTESKLFFAQEELSAQKIAASNMQAELAKFHASWYGRLRSIARRARRN